MKPGTPSLQSTRLLDQMRERIQCMHYKLRTEKNYLYWIRFFILWSATQSGGMRHPRELGVADVEAFFIHAGQGTQGRIGSATSDHLDALPTS